MLVHMIKKITFNIAILSLICFLLLVIVFMPRNLKTEPFTGQNEHGIKIGADYVTFNASMWLKDAQRYLQILSNGSLGETKRHVPVERYIQTSLHRTLFLLLTSLGLTLVFGVLKGVFDRRKKTALINEMKLVSTISFLSLPDIFVILLLQSIAVWLHQHHIDAVTVVAGDSPKSMILPLLSMTLMPIHYLSRITTLSVERIMKQPFIMTAVGKGASKLRIVWVHIFRNAVIELLGASASLLALLISCLLMVEYMFGYPGLTFMMFEYGKEPNVVMASALLLSGIYLTLDFILDTLKIALTPHVKTQGVTL